MVKEWKKQKVKEIKKELQNYSIVGLIDLDEVPSNVLQVVKQKLKNINIIVSKKSIITRALKGTDYEKLIEHLPRMPALLLTNTNPFKIYQSLENNRQPAFMKPGDTAPKTIWMEKGPTKFMPGPMITEFAKLGIKSRVKDGKIAVMKKTELIKEGETADKNVASMLRALNIQPMRKGLKLETAQEKEIVYTKDILDLDLNEYSQNISNAYIHALNLSVEAIIFNKDSIETIITKSHSQAKNLGTEAEFLSKDFIKDLIIKANAQASTLKNKTQVSS